MDRMLRGWHLAGLELSKLPMEVLPPTPIASEDMSETSGSTEDFQISEFQTTSLALFCTTRNLTNRL